MQPLTLVPVKKKQSGAFAIMFAVLLLVILGFMGLALDLGRVYNRKVDTHAIAKTVALAAARELNGQGDGIDAAVKAAGEAVAVLKYQYGLTFQWRDSAITFSTSPAHDGEWVSAGTAKASPAGRFYVRVDTSDLNIGQVKTIFMQILTAKAATVSIGDRAIAGRATVNVLPMAICAMSDKPAAPRTNPGPPATVELVEYGFRRGVSYDLMQLNPKGTTPANFVIDPLAPPGGLGSASNTSASAVRPFICTGKMWIPRLTGGMIRVTAPFPIASLYRELNSRFDKYDGGVCSANGAPSDYNVKAYAYAEAKGVTWMNPKPGRQSALGSTQDNRLQTIADLSSPPAGTVRTQYGPLWSYAKPIKFSFYSAADPNPTDPSAFFSTTDWASLYPPTPAPAASGYPYDTPYVETFGDMYSEPSTDHLRAAELNRRVLRVPLLACEPVPTGTNVQASVVAVGKFFMTVPASETSIHAEFAGIVPDHALTGQVVLYP